MDRRQLKTQKAICEAFRALLKEKRYDRISVSDIINKANVGRSTFYAHFETKDMLLKHICDHLFFHIFDSDPCPYNGNEEGIEARLSHILWHIREGKEDLSGILLSDSGDLFMKYFKEQLINVFSEFINAFDKNVPKDFLLNHLVGSFSETVLWWIREGMKTSPEAVAKYFISLTK